MNNVVLVCRCNFQKHDTVAIVERAKTHKTSPSRNFIKWRLSVFTYSSYSLLRLRVQVRDYWSTTVEMSWLGGIKFTVMPYTTCHWVTVSTTRKNWAVGWWSKKLLPPSPCKQPKKSPNKLYFPHHSNFPHQLQLWKTTIYIKSHHQSSHLRS